MLLHKNTAGFSLIEMIVTLSIMAALGLVGVVSVSSLQGQFTVGSAQSKIESTIKDAKQAVLQGEFPCSSVTIPSGDAQEASFFLVERWGAWSSLSSAVCLSRSAGAYVFSSPVQSSAIVQASGKTFFDIRLRDLGGISVVPEALDTQGQKVPLYDSSGTQITSAITASATTVLRMKIGETSDYRIKLLDATDQTRGIASVDLHFYNATSTLLLQNNPVIIHTESVSGVAQSGDTKTGDLFILFKSPSAQSTILLKSGTDYIRVKNIQLQFLNENADAGSFSFYNASLFSSRAQDRPHNKKSEQRIACFINQDSLNWVCDK